jgi:hypothetical protein
MNGLAYSPEHGGFLYHTRLVFFRISLIRRPNFVHRPYAVVAV